MAHTPGPWTIVDYGRSPVGIQAAPHNGAALAKVYLTPHGGRKRAYEFERNAALIAAAPDMYDALLIVSRCVADAQGGTTLGTWEMEQIRAALAKAGA